MLTDNNLELTWKIDALSDRLDRLATRLEHLADRILDVEQKTDKL